MTNLAENDVWVDVSTANFIAGDGFRTDEQIAIDAAMAEFDRQLQKDRDIADSRAMWENGEMDKELLDKYANNPVELYKIDPELAQTAWQRYYINNPQYQLAGWEESLLKEPIMPFDGEIGYQLPNEGPGWKNYAVQNNPELHKFCTQETAETFINSANEWNKNNPDNPIYMNDFSLEYGGYTPEHPYGHETGNEFDIKWQSEDGQYYPGDYTDPIYDREKTIEMIETFINSTAEGYEVNSIYFNDPDVIEYFRSKNIRNSYGEYVVQRRSGHSNHLHFNISKRSPYSTYPWDI